MSQCPLISEFDMQRTLLMETLNILENSLGALRMGAINDEIIDNHCRAITAIRDQLNSEVALPQIDQIIHGLFSTRWSGDLRNAPIKKMRAQLYKNLNDQLNGYWSGHTAYHILIDGDFIIDAPIGKKVATKLGQMFIDEMENSHGLLQASCPQVSAPAKSVVVSLEPIVKKVVIDLAMGIRIRSECNIEQPFDVKRSIKSIGRRIYGCIQISDFERAARLHKVYAALKEVSDGKH
ncbi:hypothetical protein [Vibrio cholerae]|uniref:hypothetical protein n=1 Tax=Vibrio cholerae TaxID=666 RepID=UPI0000F34DB0|nr:hypothetical protein [Vibrio cholerae]APF79513.1 hypothetical protein ASZ85_01987 [Vibrio cholerae]APF83471.1 hypothetical protein ASZ86_02051 [Vibrio cholerae]EAZ73615.1 hypothetical protein A5C_2072 [Vibrio cholerae NCTC 8457]